MSMRLASVFLSLLAHGTVLLYLGSFTPPDRSALVASGKSLRVALVRAENLQQEEVMPPESEAVTKPDPTRAAYQPNKPKPVVSANESDRLKAVQQLLDSKIPSAAGRPVKTPATAVSKKREPPAVQHAEPPAPPTLPEPESADQPVIQRLANASPNAGSVEQHAPTESPQQSTEALREIEQSYMNALVAAIERHKRYPLLARRKGYEGEVQVLFTVLRDGTFSKVEIGSSSLRVILDRAASKAVRDLGRFKPIPPQLDRDYWEFRVPIRFTMN